MNDIFSYIPYVTGAIACLALLIASVYTVEEMEAAVITRFGKFVRIERKGIHLKLPFIESADTIDLAVQQFEVPVSTKTRDNFLLTIPVSVQYYVLMEKIYEAYYKLADPEEQIESYVSNAILGHIPSMTFDEAFTQQGGIAQEIREKLERSMLEFGYGIKAALITDMEPSDEVKAALNEKIKLIQEAEGESESKRLQGVGIANERKAIMEGLGDAVEVMAASMHVNSESAIHLLLLTQHYDTMKSLAKDSDTNTVFYDKSPSGLNDVSQQISNGFLAVQPAALELAGRRR